MRNTNQSIMAAAVALAVMAGCSTTQPLNPSVPAAAGPAFPAVPQQVQDRLAELNNREQQLAARQQEIEKRLKVAQDTELDVRVKQDALNKANLSAAEALKAPPQREISKVTDAGLMPPNARPGECYARVLTPPQYRTRTERVLSKAADERVTIVPARYGQATDQVLVRAASKRLEVVPAVYGWEEERVLVRAASKRIIEIPAEYEMKTERVLVRPASTVWKKGVAGPITRVDAATGEVLCLVEEPAEYKTVTTRVVKRPAATREVEVPAEYTTVRRQVMKSPPTTREIEVPPQYQTVAVNKLVEPAREVRVPVPEEFQTLTHTEMVSDGKVEWRSILCETNATTMKIAEIQRALMKAGFNPGKADGRLNAETVQAVNRYQSNKGLPVDRFLNIETVKSLGVNPR
ncbi:MAG: peptidoglycan-binding domain-containing protein [Burkholderiales bacterium]